MENDAKFRTDMYAQRDSVADTGQTSASSSSGLKRGGGVCGSTAGCGGFGVSNTMTRRSFLGFAASAVAMAGFGLSGCGASDSQNASSHAVQTIKDRKVLKAGVKKDVPGYGYFSPSTDAYEGLEIDLCYAVAAKIFDCTLDDAKKKHLCEFTDVTPKTRGPLIDNGTLDLIAATYTITDERKQSWDFSESYYQDSVGFLVKKGSNMHALADLDQKAIGVSQGSLTKKNITELLQRENVNATPTFQEFADYTSLKSALDSGNIDVFSVDRSILNGYNDTSTELLCPDLKFGVQDYGIATKKGSDLSALVNEVVGNLKRTGELATIAGKYGLSA